MAAQPPTQPSARPGGQIPTRHPAKPQALRCFIGLPLPESWQEGLARVTLRLSAELRSRISWTRPGNWHLTLKFLGEVDEPRLPELSQALRGVCFAPLALAVGCAGVFPQAGAPRVLWAGLAQGRDESARLAAQVEHVLAPLGFAPEARPFAPHLTLGRVRQAAEAEVWALVQRAVAEQPWPRATVGSFVLWRSVLGPGGPSYSRLAEFSSWPE